MHSALINNNLNNICTTDSALKVLKLIDAVEQSNGSIWKNNE